MMKEIPVESLQLNPMMQIGHEWMLLTAGSAENSYNTMTVAWGHLGVIWNRPGNKRPCHYLPTVAAYVRPQRYTKEFMDREEPFTLSVLDESQRPALTYLGSHSGRDGDKVAAAGLTPVFEDGVTYFQEARLVYVCRKLYHQPLHEEGFCDPSLVEYNYPQKDFHEMYIGEIVKVLQKD